MMQNSTTPVDTQILLLENSEPSQSLGLFRLLFSPKIFFLSTIHSSNAFITLFIMWIVGTVAFFDYSTTSLVKFDTEGYDISKLGLVHDWIRYWSWCITFGLANGFFYYVVGGFFFRFKIWLCGAKRPDIFLSRRIYLYSSLVSKLPSLVYILFATCFYRSLLEFLGKESWLDTLYLAFLVLFTYWSIYIEYRGVRTCFSLRKWSSRLLFLGLPGFFNVFFIGALIFPHVNSSQRPQTLFPQTFHNDSFTFDYPGNWSVIDDEDSTVWAEIPQDAYFEVSLADAAETPKDLTQLYVEENFDLQAERAEKTVVLEWGIYQGYGYRFRYMVEDTAYTCMIFAANYPNKTFLLYYNIQEKDEAAVQPGIELIQKSFRFKSP